MPPRRNRTLALGAAGVGAGLAVAAAYTAARRHRDEILDLRHLLVEVFVTAGFEERYLRTEILCLVDLTVGLPHVMRIGEVRNGHAQPI